MTYRILFLASVAAWFVTSTANAAPVYSNNFETNTTGFTVAGTTFNGPSNRVVLATNATGTTTSNYLGRIATGTATLNLTGLTVGNLYTISFDLFIGASWDGNNPTFGPDQFRVSANSNTILNTTFSNITTPGFSQNYSDSLAPGTFAAGTGADVSNIVPNFYNSYTIYSFGNGGSNPTVSFGATSTSATVVFAGINLQPAQTDGTPDEFWALDNVVVNDAGLVVPVPGNLVLLGSVALFGFAGRTIRRIRKS